MSIKSDLKFKIRKWTKFEDLSIRPRTVRLWTADRPPYQDLDSSSQQCRQSELPGHGPSIAPARTVRDRQLNRAEPVNLSLSSVASPLTLSTRLKVTFDDCVHTVKWSCAWTVRKLAGSSTIMSSSWYFIISWISTNFFKFGDSSDFLSDLELSNRFTNLIGGIVSATHCECCAKIWTSLDGYFLPNRRLNDWGS
jgi:hypothetical protein